MLKLPDKKSARMSCRKTADSKNFAYQKYAPDVDSRFFYATFAGLVGRRTASGKPEAVQTGDQVVGRHAEV